MIDFILEFTLTMLFGIVGLWMFINSKGGKRGWIAVSFLYYPLGFVLIYNGFIFIQVACMLAATFSVFGCLINKGFREATNDYK